MKREGLAAANGVYHFYLVAFAQCGGFVLAARHNVQVEFDRHPATRQVKPVEQGRDAFAIGQFESFTVQLNAHAHGRHYF